MKSHREGPSSIVIGAKRVMERHPITGQQVGASGVLEPLTLGNGKPHGMRALRQGPLWDGGMQTGALVHWRNHAAAKRGGFVKPNADSRPSDVVVVPLLRGVQCVLATQARANEKRRRLVGKASYRDPAARHATPTKFGRVA